MPKYKLTFTLAVVRTEIIEAQSAFGAWNRLKKRWNAGDFENLRIDPRKTRIQFLSHENIDDEPDQHT